MSTSTTFMAIKEKDLKSDKVPAAVRKFVEDFFESKTMFGEAAYVCIGIEEREPWSDMNGEDYQEGLVNGESVFDWFDNNPDIAFTEIGY